MKEGRNYITEYKDSYWNYYDPIGNKQKSICAAEKREKVEQIPKLMNRISILEENSSQTNIGTHENKEKKRKTIGQHKFNEKQKKPKSFVFTNNKPLNIKPRVIVHIQDSNTTSVKSDS